MEGAHPQVLTIPPDSTRWLAMQKNLTIGGVYQVVATGSTQRKYCLWNGSQLVPCKLLDVVFIVIYALLFKIVCHHI